MSKNHTRVQWTLPTWAADLIFETLQLDSESKALNRELRKELVAALETVTETDLSQPRKSK